MNLSEILFSCGFTRTIAPGRGESQGKTVEGRFRPGRDLGANGPAELLGRYGLKLEPTAGTFGGEARPDPSVIAAWLRGTGFLGGVTFLKSALDHGLVEAKDLESPIDAPDNTTTQDFMLISRDGQTTAYASLLLPWLEATGGGQHPEAGELVAGESAAEKVAELESRLAATEIATQRDIDGLRARISALEGKRGAA